MHIIHSKHQKLILQCYPPGKAVDKKPNSSELQYLLYYASTRTVKLEKVMTFLVLKTQLDVSRGRAGNLQVTLAIIQALINKCLENLNVFATKSCEIIQLVLKVRDVALAKSSVETHGVLCSHLDGGLFTGDKEFVELFTVLSDSLIDLASSPDVKSGPDVLDWECVSIKACANIVSILDYNPTIGRKFTLKCIPILLNFIRKSNDSAQKLKSRLGKMSDDKRASASTPLIPAGTIEKELDLDSLTPKQLEKLCILSLKLYFNNSLTPLIAESTRVLVQSTINNKDPQWGPTLLEICTLWVPLQLRFVTLSTILTILKTLSQDSLQKTTPTDVEACYKSQVKHALFILGLLSSEVSMIGLSVADVLQKLLSLQTSVALYQSSQLSDSQVEKLLDIYSRCICNLSTHVYYFDQIPDVIQGILFKMDSVLEDAFEASSTSLQSISSKGAKSTAKSTNSGTETSRITTRLAVCSPKRLHAHLISLLQNIRMIFTVLKDKPTTITRNYVQLDHWLPSLLLLSPETDFDKYDPNVLPPKLLNDIQCHYLQVFRIFLNQEVAADSGGNNLAERLFTVESSSSDPETPSTGSLVHKISSLQVADHNRYITNPDNFVHLFLLHVDKLILKKSTLTIEQLCLVIATLKELSSILGINFFANFVSFFYHWASPSLCPQELEVQGYDEASTTKDTIGYAIMHHSLRVLNVLYGGSQTGKDYVQLSGYFKAVELDIAYRREHGLWDERLDQSSIRNSAGSESQSILDEDKTPTIVVDNGTTPGINSGHKGFKATKGELQEFINDDPYFLTWINPYNLLAFDGAGMRHTETPARGYTHDVSSDDSAHSDIGNVTNGHSFGIGLGLGTAGDIISIHSEIVNNLHILPPHQRGFHRLDDILELGSAQRTYAPSVHDLKSSVMNRSEFNDKYSGNGSVLSRLIKKNVKLILLELDDDLEQEIIV